MVTSYECALLANDSIGFNHRIPLGISTHPTVSFSEKYSSLWGCDFSKAPFSHSSLKSSNEYDKCNPCVYRTYIHQWSRMVEHNSYYSNTNGKDDSKSCSCELDNLGAKHLRELRATADTPDKRGLRSIDRRVTRRSGSPKCGARPRGCCYD